MKILFVENQEYLRLLSNPDSKVVVETDNNKKRRAFLVFKGKKIFEFFPKHTWAVEL